MAFLNKTYTLDHQENFDAFLDTLKDHVTEAIKAALLADKPTVRLTQNGDTYTLATSNLDKSLKEVSFKPGVEFDETVGTAAKAKSTVTLEGNVLNHVQKFEDGTTFTIQRQFLGDEVVATITTSKWDGSAKRVYKA